MTWTSAKLKLSVAEPVIFFRGTPEEAPGCFLRGDLMLNLPKPTKFKKIELFFRGFTEAKLPSGLRDNYRLTETKEIISHTWVILAPLMDDDDQPLASSPKPTRFKFLRHSNDKSIQSHILTAGVHTFPFELLLPGNLPPTIKTEFCKLKYSLSAKATRDSIFPNLSLNSSIEIVRTLSDTSRGISVSRDANETFAYEINIPESAYPLGNRIPVDVKVIPHVKRFRLYSVKFEIIEKSTYKVEQYKFTGTRTVVQTKTDDVGRMQLIDREEEGDIGNVSYNRTLSIQLPKCSGPISYSCETPLLTVSHVIKVTFLVNVPYQPGRKLAVRVTTPITLLSCRCVSDYQILPKYEDDSYYCPCDPVYQRAARLVLGDAANIPEVTNEPPPPYTGPVVTRYEMVDSDAVSSTTATATADNTVIDGETVVEMMDGDAIEGEENGRRAKDGDKASYLEASGSNNS